jgi:hypothetical protein
MYMRFNSRKQKFHVFQKVTVSISLFFQEYKSLKKRNFKLR